MTNPKQQAIRTAVVAALIAAAYLPNLLWWIYGISLPSYFSHQRNLIYLGLFTAWGVSVRHRIIQKQARRYLLAISGLMVFWVLVRCIKYHFVEDPDIIRQLWYMYYIPMLLIPSLCLLVALSLGRPEHYRLPKRTGILMVPTAVLLLLVLTNDWHQLVFAFPAGKVWTDRDYTHLIVYWLIAAWELQTACATLGILIAKCRVPRSRKVLWLPFIPLTACVLYSVLYVTGWPVLRLVARDISIIFCLLFTATLESCIRCGLIQSNSRYAELFQASAIGAQIVEGGNVLLASEGAAPVDRDTALLVQAAPVLLSDGIRLSSAPLRRGHVIWQEDVSDLLRVIAALEDVDEELKDKNSTLAEEYKTRRTRQALVEKNRLYNKVQSQTEGQIRQLGALTARLAHADGPEEIRMLVAHIAVLTAYIKRRNNLIFIAEESGMVPACELEYCIKETLVNLRLAGVACHLRTLLAAPLPFEQLAFLYDRFEAVVEASIGALKGLYGSVLMENGAPEMHLTVVCGEDLTPLADEWLRVEPEGEWEWALTCTAPEGGLSP